MQTFDVSKNSPVKDGRSLSGLVVSVSLIGLALFADGASICMSRS